MTIKNAICVVLTLVLGGCTAPLVNEGVTKFHAASEQANTALISNANDVVAVSRFRFLMQRVNPQGTEFRVGPVNVSPKAEASARDFANYVCLQSSKFALLRARQGALARLDVSDDKAKAAPKTKEQVEAKVRENFESCLLEVVDYVLLPQGELPPVGTLPVGAEAGLAPGGVMAGAALVGAVVKLLKSVYDGVQAEAKAAEIKSIVGRPETQRLVLTALNELSRADQDPVDFCRDAKRKTIWGLPGIEWVISEYEGVGNACG